MIDILIKKIEQVSNPTCVGLDTSFEYLPDSMRGKAKSMSDAAKLITEFNCTIIDKVCKIVPAVKVQVAYYEMYGVEGMMAFRDTLEYARKNNLVVISDVKRNDIGSTASCYSKAYLSSVTINSKVYYPFCSDFITVNGYLGSDGIMPFVLDCKANRKGIFVLVKTSNPSSAELQDKILDSGKPLYLEVAELVNKWGEAARGEYGYSSVGAVVGATHPRQAEVLRQAMPHTFFLVPGYGAQGGKASDIKVCFDADGRGAIVNNSRGLLTAYRTDKYKGQSYYDACYNACIDMREELTKI